MSQNYSPKELASKLLKGETIDIDMCSWDVIGKAERLIDLWAKNLLSNAIRKDLEGT